MVGVWSPAFVCWSRCNQLTAPGLRNKISHNKSTREPKNWDVFIPITVTVQRSEPADHFILKVSDSEMPSGTGSCGFTQISMTVMSLQRLIETDLKSVQDAALS